MNILGLSQPAHLPLPRKDRKTVVLFGDSIIGNGIGFVAGNYGAYSVRCPFVAYQIMARQPFFMLANKGVGGNTTDQMLARLASDVLSYQPGYVYMNGGTNDLGTKTAAQVTGNLEKMFKIMRAQGIVVIMQTILPRADIDYTTQQKLYAVNWWIRDYCERNDGMVLADLYDAALDRSSTANAEGCVFNPSYCIADGIHPNELGGWMLGKALLDQLPFRGPTLLGNGSRFSETTGDQNNLVKNSKMMLGASSTNGPGCTGPFFEGCYPTQIVGTGASAVGSVIDRSAAPAFFGGASYGSVQKMVVTSSSSSDIIGWRHGFYPQNVAGGTKLVTETEVYAVATSGTLAYINTKTGFDSDMSGTNILYVNQTNSLPAGLTEFYGVLRSPVYTVPETYANKWLWFEVKLSTGGSAEVYVGNQTVRKVTI
jgi:lysophospholipase L1-like esterase